MNYRVEMPPRLVQVFSGQARYRGAYGGRGSGKSYNFAKMLAIRGMQQPIKALCCREIQATIRHSSMAQIIEAIDSEPWLTSHYRYGESYIKGRNGTEFQFRGLRHNSYEIRGFTGADVAWVEEAEAVSEKSWRDLIPTIRKPGSEIWLTWNPLEISSATHRRFITNPPPRSKIVKLNWRNNPWFGAELEQERRHDLELNPDIYHHIWEGECLTRTDAQVLRGKWTVRSFTPREHWDGPYYGLDFGFSDPTAVVECWTFDNRLYIHREAVRTAVEYDAIASMASEIMPDIANHIVRADSANPATIEYLKRHGLPRIIGTEKWANSVQEGMAHIRNYKQIVIHPDCERTISEARLYSYKVDRNDQITNTILDAHNHTWDAVRYALSPMIKRKGGTDYMKMLRD